MESIFVQVVELLKRHPNLTETEIIEKIPDLHDKAHPEKSLWSLLKKYNKGEIKHTSERPRRWSIS